MSKINKCCDLTSNYANVIDEFGRSKDNILTVRKPSKNALCIALDIINEILENAMDAAATKSTLTNQAGEQFENFCKKKTLKDDTRFLREMANVNLQNEQQQIQNLNLCEMIEGIRLSNQSTTKNTEEPLRIDVETKRFLDNIMSSNYNNQNIENSSPRKDGVGDQPCVTEETSLEEDPRLENDNTRIVEKKSRVTDLVMNSKQVLTEIFLNDEEKKKQEEWEQSKENVIQVINLECVESHEMDKLMEKVHLTTVESVGTTTRNSDDDAEEAKEKFTPMPKDDVLDTIDLSTQAFQDEENKLCCLREERGKGDDCKTAQNVDLLPRSSKSLPSSSTQSKENLQDAKKNKKKRWNFGKLFGFIKKHSHKQQQQEQQEQQENQNENLVEKQENIDNVLDEKRN